MSEVVCTAMDHPRTLPRMRMNRAASIAPKKDTVRMAKIANAGFVHGRTRSYSALHFVVSGNSWSCSCAFCCGTRRGFHGGSVGLAG
jgi:hypothetical protein